jgi:hypothetical protein
LKYPKDRRREIIKHLIIIILSNLNDYEY